MRNPSICNEISPHLTTTREKPTHSNEDPVQQKIKNKTTLHMENFLINVDFFYKTANFYLVFRASPSLQFLKNNQSKIIHMPKRHILG